MAQLKAILNQLEMNLRNSENRFQVAPQDEDEAEEREKERGRRASKGSCKLFFLTHQAKSASPPTSLRTSEMSAHHFDEPPRRSAKEAIKRGKAEEAARRRRHKNHNKAKIGFHSGEIW